MRALRSLSLQVLAVVRLCKSLYEQEKFENIAQRHVKPTNMCMKCSAYVDRCCSRCVSMRPVWWYSLLRIHDVRSVETWIVSYCFRWLLKRKILNIFASCAWRPHNSFLGFPHNFVNFSGSKPINCMEAIFLLRTLVVIDEQWIQMKYKKKWNNFVYLIAFQCFLFPDIEQNECSIWI